jgi:hypothetical protein
MGGSIDERFAIARPTIEIPLDEVLSEMNMGGCGVGGAVGGGYDGGRESPSAWSSSAAGSGVYGGQEDVEMKIPEMPESPEQNGVLFFI